METVYVMTGRPIWRQMTKFWGTLFGINFVLGVATGITMEFQFGMNWSYYSHYVGDIFGAPLAIEGLMAFFLEATFVGLFFFGWDRLCRVGHLVVDLAGGASGSNFSALWILIANGWMQNPVGAAFNPDTMRMEMTSLLRRGVQPGGAGEVRAYRLGRLCHRLGLRARRLGLVLLKGRHVELARRSIAVAASFGLASALSVVVLGDESGYDGHAEPEDEARRDRGDVGDRAGAGALHRSSAFPTSKRARPTTPSRIPWVMGLIGTRSLTTADPRHRRAGEARPRRASARVCIAYDALIKIREAKGDATPAAVRKTLRGAFGRSRLCASC